MQVGDASVRRKLSFFESIRAISIQASCFRCWWISHSVFALLQLAVHLVLPVAVRVMYQSFQIRYSLTEANSTGDLSDYRSSSSANRTRATNESPNWISNECRTNGLTLTVWLERFESHSLNRMVRLKWLGCYNSIRIELKERESLFTRFGWLASC